MIAKVKCKVLVELEKEIELSEKEYELISSCNGYDIDSKSKEEFRLLNDKILINPAVDGPEEFLKISVSQK